jgi:hypothetical protein
MIVVRHGRGGKNHQGFTLYLVSGSFLFMLLVGVELFSGNFSSCN